MNNKLFLLALAATAFTFSACTTEQKASTAADLPPGQYERTTKSTNTAGTSTMKKTSTDVGYDANGRKQATVKTETTSDPKGLFNKSTSTSTSTVKK